MNRAQKYPNTETFVFHNQNPHNRFTSACVIRAISAATKIPYNEVVMGLAEIQCKTGFDDGETKCIDRYLKSKGWEMQKQPRKDDNTKYTGEQFCRALKRGELEFKNDDRIVANIGGHHMVAIINWQIWDTWDSTDGCIGRYWVKK